MNEGYCDTRYKYDRFNFRGNLDFDLTKSTVLSFNIGGDISIQNTPGEDPWRPVYQASTTLYPAYYPAWVLEQVPDLDYPDASGDRLAAAQNDARGNPYSALHQGKFNEYTSSKLFTDLILKQNLDMVTKGLSVQAKVSLSTYYKNKSLTADWSVPQYTLNFDKIGTGILGSGKVREAKVGRSLRWILMWADWKMAITVICIMSFHWIINVHLENIM